MQNSGITCGITLHVFQLYKFIRGYFFRISHTFFETIRVQTFKIFPTKYHCVNFLINKEIFHMRSLAIERFRTK